MIWETVQHGTDSERAKIKKALATTMWNGVTGHMCQHARGFYVFDQPKHGQLTYGNKTVTNWCGLYVFAVVLNIPVPRLLRILESSLSHPHWSQISSIIDDRIGISQVDGMGMTSDSVRDELNSKFVASANNQLDWTLSIEDMFFLAALFGIPLAVLSMDFLYVNKAPNSERTVTVLLEDKHYKLIVDHANVDFKANITRGNEVKIMKCKFGEIGSELVLEEIGSELVLESTHPDDVTSSDIIPVIGIQDPVEQVHSASVNNGLDTNGCDIRVPSAAAGEQLHNQDSESLSPAGHDNSEPAGQNGIWSTLAPTRFESLKEHLDRCLTKHVVLDIQAGDTVSLFPDEENFSCVDCHSFGTYAGTLGEKHKVIHASGLRALARVLCPQNPLGLLPCISKGLSNDHWKDIKEPMKDRLGCDPENLRLNLMCKFFSNSDTLDWSLSVEEMFFVAAFFGMPLAVITEYSYFRNRAPIGNHGNRTVVLHLQEKHHKFKNYYKLVLKTVSDGKSYISAVGNKGPRECALTIAEDNIGNKVMRLLDQCNYELTDAHIKPILGNIPSSPSSSTDSVPGSAASSQQSIFPNVPADQYQRGNQIKRRRDPSDDPAGKVSRVA